MGCVRIRWYVLLAIARKHGAPGEGKAYKDSSEAKEKIRLRFHDKHDM
jgi:hypothetical protein